MFGNDRNSLRQVFYDCWQKHQQNTPLDALQTVIVSIIELHPEYQPLLADPDAIDKDFTPEAGETNPFLHMSMHIALHEQISTDRPAGIKSCYQRLCEAAGSAHEAEHRMMECLGEILWTAQRNNLPPDEVLYLECIETLLRK